MGSALVFGDPRVRAGAGDLAAARQRRSDYFITGERSFGPVLMYFVMGAMVFERVRAAGHAAAGDGEGIGRVLRAGLRGGGVRADFLFGARVRRIGAREGLVTQAEFWARFASRRLTAIMGLASLLACVPYIVIQFKGAGIVMQQVLGGPGAGRGGGVRGGHAVRRGMRGVGWTNVLQGVVMLAVVWWLGLAIPQQLFGGVGPCSTG